MPRGVKRQITTKDNQKEEDVVHETSSSTKRIRSVSNKEENMILFENMKKEAEENRKRVLKEYLQDQNMPLAVNQPTVKPSRRETIAATSTSSSRTPTGRRKSVDGKSTAKSPKRTDKSPIATTAKSTSATAPKPSRSRPAKSPTKKAETKPESSFKSPVRNSSTSAAKSMKVQVAEVENVSSNVVKADDETVPDDWCGQLYPSIALSDAANAIGHLCGAFIALNNGQELACLGFLSVWLAAMVGVLRFGVSEKLFEQPNRDLASFAAFVGYPLIGLSFADIQYPELKINVVIIGFVLVAWETMTRSFVEKNKELAKLATNIILFVGPIATVCHETKDVTTAAALLAFVLAGVAITPHHENRILGIRCVDWFHWIIGATAVVFARGLGRVA